MASQSIATDETFFNGIINTQIALGTENDEFVDSTVVSLNQRNKKPKGKKSLVVEKPNIKKSRKSGADKENAAPKNTVEKKQSKSSTETKREVLKVLNRNSPAKSPTTKPKSSPRKSHPITERSPRKTKAARKSVETPKIIVYQDASSLKTKRTQKAERQESKSWNGRSIHDKKSPKLVESSNRKSTRHSMKDLTNLNFPKEEFKSSKSKLVKTPSKGRGRLSKIDPKLESLLVKLENVFPNVDPNYLKNHFLKFKGSLSETIDYLILKEKTDDLPTKADYEKRQETERQQRNYVENFSVENFLKIFPDPWEYFLKQEKQNCEKYAEHSFHYLKNKFKKHYTQAIRAILIKCNYSLYRANKELQKKNRLMKMRATNRSKAECDSGRPTTYDEQFMHEMAFIENEAKIKSYIKKTETVKHKKFKEAKKAGRLLECLFCNDPSLLLDDVVNCPANHVFCKDCVVKSIELEMNKNNFRFKCLVKCDEIFPMESLQRVLSSEAIEMIQNRNQLEEVKAAGIKDLVWCPFCCYAIIMPPELTVLNCLNPDCLKETCRQCKQLNHVPLKCHELEKFDKTIVEDEDEDEDENEDENGDEDEDEEEKADPSLICIQCNKEFLETDETNKLVCPCGATICSICRQPIPECAHFKDEPAKNGPKEVLSTSNGSDVTDTANDVKDSPISKIFDFDGNLADFYPASFHSF